jgi:hypothetical protein
MLKTSVNATFLSGYSGIETATMFGAGGGFSAFTQPTGYGFDFHTGNRTVCTQLLEFL